MSFNAARSNASPSANVVSCPSRITRLAVCAPLGERDAITPAMRSACASSTSPATTALTSPISAARFAVTGSPVKIISSARAAPINRGRRCVPPAPGMAPIRASVNPICASCAAIRKSHAIAISQPPPSAKPLMTAMVGMGAAASASTAALIARLCWTRAASSMVRRSFRSAPAQNARPLPRTSITRAWPATASAMAACSASTMSTPSALRRSGRLRTMRAMPSLLLSRVIPELVRTWLFLLKSITEIGVGDGA